MTTQEPLDLETIKARHRIDYDVPTMDMNPPIRTCKCRKQYPCDAAALIAEVERLQGDVTQGREATTRARRRGWLLKHARDMLATQLPAAPSLSGFLAEVDAEIGRDWPSPR